MKHYSDEAWADFVRGVAATHKKTEMAAHLETGCASCRSSVMWIQQVAGLDQTPVPPDVVKSARGIFPAAASQNTWIGSLRNLAADLIFAADNAWQPAGVRSASAPQMAKTKGSGRLIFDAGDYRIHVKIELPTANEPGEIVGEITNRYDPADSLEGAIVQALASGRTIRETTANRFGEFVIDYPFVEDTTLRLALREKGVRIDLSLDQSSRRQSGVDESQ